MAKKTRRRKNNNDDDETADVELLPEDHTVADSLATSFEGDFDDDDRSIDDLLSTASGVSQAAATNRHARAVDILGDAAELISEKRSVKREAGLRKLFKAITQYSTADLVAQYQEDLLTLCSQSLRAGSPAEQYAACRTLEAMGVVLGADQDDFFDTVDPLLRRVVNMASRAMMVRGAALRAISLINFCCSTDEQSTEALMDVCEAVAEPEFRQHAVPATLRATALECWALLTTTIHDFYISGASDETIGRGIVLMPLLQKCLEEGTMELRVAAGECMALIHESRLNLGEQNGDSATERKYAQGGWEGSPQEDIFNEILQNVSELSNQSGHNISKKAKKEQRAAFREYLATLQDDEPPDEIVSFRGGDLSLTSWREIVQLNFVRHSLQGGFQNQLLTNPTLQTIFGADGNVLNQNGQLSQLEKRLFMSKTSEAAKLAHVDLTKKRRNRNNVKNHFLTCDGEGL